MEPSRPIAKMEEAKALMQSISGLPPALLATRPRMVPAAHPTDAAREQLEYLADHTAGGFCASGCGDCALLLHVRKLLLAKFEDGPIPIEYGRRK